MLRDIPTLATVPDQIRSSDPAEQLAGLQALRGAVQAGTMSVAEPPVMRELLQVSMEFLGTDRAEHVQMAATELLTDLCAANEDPEVVMPIMGVLFQAMSAVHEHRPQVAAAIADVFTVLFGNEALASAITSVRPQAIPPFLQLAAATPHDQFKDALLDCVLTCLAGLYDEAPNEAASLVRGGLLQNVFSVVGSRHTADSARRLVMLTETMGEHPEFFGAFVEQGGLNLLFEIIEDFGAPLDAKTGACRALQPLLHNEDVLTAFMEEGIFRIAHIFGEVEPAVQHAMAGVLQMCEPALQTSTVTELLDHDLLPALGSMLSELPGAALSLMNALLAHLDNEYRDGLKQQLDATGGLAALTNLALAGDGSARQVLLLLGADVPEDGADTEDAEGADEAPAAADASASADGSATAAAAAPAAEDGFDAENFAF